MKDIKAEVIDCIQNIKSLRQKEDSLIDHLMSTIKSNPAEILGDGILRDIETPLARCAGCTHWDGLACDIIYYGCQFELKQ